MPGHGAPVLTRVETTDPVVFLTIDDGVTRSPEALAEFQRLPVWGGRFGLVGYLADGRQVRVAWFDHARLD